MLYLFVDGSFVCLLVLLDSHYFHIIFRIFLFIPATQEATTEEPLTTVNGDLTTVDITTTGKLTIF